MRCVLRCTVEAAEGELCLMEMLEVPEVPEVMRCALLCMLEAVRGGLCLLEVLRGAGGGGDDAMCATLYAGGCGE